MNKEAKIMKAEFNDLPEILSLQKLAYQSEARLVNDFTIAPLTQTLGELEDDFVSGTILKAVRDGKTIGSVRGKVIEDTLHIGRLMVDPQYQNQGIGTMLLTAIERMYPNLRFELFTSALSDKNLRLYQKNGYKEFKRKRANENLTLIYLEKLQQVSCREDDKHTYMLMGLSIGICFGVAFGLLFNNIAFGIPIGMCFGIGIGSMIDRYKSKEK